MYVPPSNFINDAPPVCGLVLEWIDCKNDMANTHLTDKELLNQFKQIEKLPVNDISVVKIFLDAFLTKKKIQQLAG